MFPCYTFDESLWEDAISTRAVLTLQLTNYGIPVNNGVLNKERAVSSALLMMAVSSGSEINWACYFHLQLIL